MDTAPHLIAMVQYHTFAEWIGALHNIKFLLLYAAVAAFVVACYRTLRDEQPRTSYFTGKFWSGLLPLILCMAAAMAEYARLNWDWRSYFRSLAEATFIHILIFGVLLSGIATAIYSWKRNRPLVLKSPGAALNSR